MRIISGIRRGHKLIGFDGDDIRPTTDRVKESLFNLIQGYIQDAAVLDLFAGSGALGFEAMSRGARCVTFVDASKSSVEVVSKNADSLNFGDGVKILNMTYSDFFGSSRECFDLIFLDPPYNKGFIEPVLVDIVNRNRLSKDGIIVLESDDTDMHSEFDGLSVIKQRKYGRTYITIYQRG